VNSALRRGGTAFVTVLLVLTGCGDGGETAGGGTSPTTMQAATTAATAAPQTTAATTTIAATSTTSGRSPIPTTTSAAPGETQVDRSLIPESTASYDFRQLVINGIAYTNALRMYSDRTADRVEINAGRNRTRFLGTAGIPDDQRSASVHQVDISLDNAAPVFSAVIPFGETREIDLDVTGVLRIRITVTSRNEDGYVAIGNPRFV
jgi:hypothetical protein